MKFGLVYNGPLVSTGSKPHPDEVRDVRDKLHPQLKYLWEVHTALKRLKRTAIVRKKDSGLNRYDPVDTPFDSDTGAYRPANPVHETNLCEPIKRDAKTYVPLVRKSLDLVCELEILFLRQEDPGSLTLQGGEVDNRIKTLLDAMRIPDLGVEERHPQQNDPVYCLLENDTLVSRLEVSTDRLLFPRTEYPNEVHLIIEVIVRVLRVGDWNVCLLGN